MVSLVLGCAVAVAVGAVMVFAGRRGHPAARPAPRWRGAVTTYATVSGAVVATGTILVSVGVKPPAALSLRAVVTGTAVAVLGAVAVAWARAKRRAADVGRVAGGTRAAAALLCLLALVTVCALVGRTSDAGSCTAVPPRAVPPIANAHAPSRPGDGGLHLGPAAGASAPAHAPSGAAPPSQGAVPPPPARPHRSGEKGVGRTPVGGCWAGRPR
jgi:hypothetical protein